MTNREHEVMARFIVDAEKAGPTAFRAAWGLLAGKPAPDVKAIEAKVAEFRGTGGTEPEPDK